MRNIKCHDPLVEDSKDAMLKIGHHYLRNNGAVSVLADVFCTPAQFYKQQDSILCTLPNVTKTMENELVQKE